MWSWNPLFNISLRNQLYMAADHKIGLLKFVGDRPMELVESSDGGIAESWTDEQEAMAKAVGQSIKRYVEAIAKLLSEKYQHLTEVVPAYLSTPGNMLIAICNDGVVIRYEKRGEVEPKKIAAIFPMSIAEVAAQLSQNLVHIAAANSPPPAPDTFGVEMKLQAVKERLNKS